MRRRHEFPGLRLFLGAVFSDTFAPTETDGLAFSSYGAIGKASCIVECDQTPVELQPVPIGEAERRIGEFVAPLIPDRATIQIGIGAIPDAILAALGGHRELGIHSGMIGDRVVDLIEAGVVTNAYKSFDRGVTVANCLFGTRKLSGFAERNPAIRVAPISHSHGASNLGRLAVFRAVNSALEVDLSGQMNAEQVTGRYVGTVGGQPDFVRGALAAPGGRSIIALPSTANGGATSRIVAALSGPVTTLRRDADVIVTDWGIAELRGKTLHEHADAMIAIADSKFREQLERAARGMQHLSQPLASARGGSALVTADLKPSKGTVLTKLSSGSLGSTCGHHPVPSEKSSGNAGGPQ